MPTTLGEFVSVNREELVSRCKAKGAGRASPPASDGEVDHGIPQFIDQLVDELRNGPTRADDIGMSATQHGRNLLGRGFTVGQVVHDYGDLCQAVTELALEVEAPIDTDEFRTLNRCLDDAIAVAVTEYARAKDSGPDESPNELRDLSNAAIGAFEALMTGRVGLSGSTGTALHRSLTAIRSLSERPPARIADPTSR